MDLAFKQSAIERRQNTLQLDHIDPVSQLPNEIVSRVRLRIFLSTYAVEKLAFSIVVLRLLDLKPFAAQHGMEASRLLQRVVGETLANTVRTNDFAGRWSEDEFVMVLSGCENARAPQVGQRICSLASAATIQWWGDELSASVAFGTANAVEGDTLESLVKRAYESLENRSSQASSARIASAGKD